MRRVTRALAVTAAALIALSLTGCTIPGQLRILIPDFDSAEVLGIWIWREASGSYQKMTEIQLGEIQMVEAREYVIYSVWDQSGAKLGSFPAEVIRLDGGGDSAVLLLHVAPDRIPCLVKASTYNLAGESALSSESLALTI